MTPIELGLDTFGDVTVDADGRPLSQAQVLRDVVAEAELADRVGVDFFGVGEHHRPDFAISAPEVLLAAIAARTQRIRLGTAVTVLSTDDPVRVYQRFSTLDAVSNGRAEVILGRGSFTESFPLFGYSLDDYERLFEEKLALFAAIRDADRTGEPVQWKGTVRPPLEGAAGLPPVEQPPLRTWVGVGGSPESVVRAARYGFPLTLAIIGGDPAASRRYVELYHRALAQLGARPLPLGVHSPGHIADTDDEAREELWPAYRVMRNRIGARARLAADEPGRVRARDRRGLALRRLAGDGRRQDRGDRARRSARPGSTSSTARARSPHERMLRSIELYGREVIPRVRRAAGGGRRAGGEVRGRRGSGGLDGPALRARSRSHRRGRRRGRGVPPLARAGAARRALGLPPLLARRAPRHAGHRERRDRGGHRPRRRRAPRPSASAPAGSCSRTTRRS